MAKMPARLACHLCHRSMPGIKSWPTTSRIRPARENRSVRTIHEEQCPVALGAAQARGQLIEGPLKTCQNLPETATFFELLQSPQLPTCIRLAFATGGVLGRVPILGAKTNHRWPAFRLPKKGTLQIAAFTATFTLTGDNLPGVLNGTVIYQGSVPEPAAVSLLATGLAGLAIWLWLKRPGGFAVTNFALGFSRRCGQLQ